MISPLSTLPMNPLPTEIAYRDDAALSVEIAIGSAAPLLPYCAALPSGRCD